MKIGLTGTPGTGKTTLANKLPFDIVHLNEYMRENDIGEELENGELEIDLEELKQNQPEASGKDLLIEGHLSHFLDLDYCLVLRTNPETLENRLNKRDYSEDKIEENIESEILDVILSEAVEKQENIIEVDTTGKEPKEVAKEIEDKIENRETGYGEIDWTGYL